MPQRLVAESQTVRAALLEILPAEPDIVAAYLFGSVVRGTAGPLSDIDIGLLIGDAHDREAVCGRVMDALCRRLRASRVDVVSLADAPMPLRYRVVRDGSLVACRDARVLERFIVETVLHYLDFQPVRARAFERLRQSILESR
jgi:predicted nucleotidyltransferase